jgi:hypothetical protein
MRLGILWDDGMRPDPTFSPHEAHLVFSTGVVTPSPPCKRALQIVTSLLEEDGHEIISMFVHSYQRLLPAALSCFFTVTLPAH